MGQYLPLLAMLVLAVLFCVGSFVASGLLAPRRPTERKTAPYECGIIPGADPPSRFPVTFYLVAMIFIVFDIEIIFLYPWAVAHGRLGAYGIGMMLIFAAAVFESFVYLISKGALEWGPSKQHLRERIGISPDRTTTSTIRRVGTEGRGVGPAVAAPVTSGTDDSVEIESASPAEVGEGEKVGAV